MADEDLTIKVGLTGHKQAERGLKDVATAEGEVAKGATLAKDAQGRWRTENGRLASTNEKVAAGVKELGAQTRRTGAEARDYGRIVQTVGRQTRDSLGAGIQFATRQAKYGALGLAALTLAGAKWGLQQNAQVESARERFRLFTRDVDGLTKSVQAIDASSQFNFGGLADAAAMLGNSGVQNIPKTLQAAANAAAASGKGEQALQGIVIALSQIQSKGRLSQEEINQLNEAGAPGAQRIIQQAFGLTAEQVGNLGGQALDSTKAVEALTRAWTSGEMAQAASRQARLLGGQWSAWTSNAQKLSGALTAGLARDLEKDVLPAANRATEQITEIWGREGLSNEQKLRQARAVIRRELGPVAQDIIRELDDADVAGKLEDAFEHAMSRIATVAANQAPHVVKSFVDAWLSAGPWAKLISGAWLAHKLGLDKGALDLLRGAGGGKGGASGALGGATGAVVPVYVTNWSGGVPGGKTPGGGRGPGGRSSWRDRLGGGLAKAGLAVSGYTVAHDLAMQTPLARYSGTEGWRNLGRDFGSLLSIGPNANLPTAGSGARSPSNPAGHVPFVPGAPRRVVGPGQDQIVVNPVVQALFQVDGRTLGRALATADGHEQGRRG